MTIEKGAERIPRPSGDKAQNEHDTVFNELVHQVAAELPRIEEETDTRLLPIPRTPVRRSGVYTLWTGRAVPPKPSFNSPAVPTAAAEDDESPATVDDGDALLEGSNLGARLAQATEELRIDVDGLFPTMTISGTIHRLFGGRLTWVARVVPDPATGNYIGPISYRDGASSLEPHTGVNCRLTGSWWQGSMRAHVTFIGGGVPSRTRIYRYDRPFFRDVGIEYDWVQGVTPVTSYQLHSHPNRPADLPGGTLTVEDVYTRQGIRMTRTGGDKAIPIADAGANQRWSDLEMHDAMQRHWSRYQDSPQWQIWTLFAGQHEMGYGLGGVMFDDIGKAQRQGCAVFMNSFISNPAPAGDPAPAAYVRRMQFWTTVHEIGHSFNLAHSWQKSLGKPWVPLHAEPESRSYMNYPYNVTGGANAFFKDFYHRFSDDELLFLRHAPDRFVQPGDAAWFDEHGFEQARVESAATLTLAIRFNRAAPRFQALEPIVAEVKLKNTSGVPVVVDRNALRGDDLVVIIARNGREPRQWVPYLRHCTLAEPKILEPGEAVYGSLYLSAGLNGFDLAEPGTYRIYVALRTGAGDVLSKPAEIKILPFASREQEFLAEEVYEDQVGRVLAFGGSRVLDQALATLREVVDRMPESRIGIHAAAALGRVAAMPGLVLEDFDSGPQLVIREAQTQEASHLLGVAYGDLDAAAETFGHIRLTEQVTRAACGLAAEGERRRGRELTERLARALADRGVLPGVVAEVRNTAKDLTR